MGRMSKSGRRPLFLLLSVLMLCPALFADSKTPAAAYGWQCGTGSNYFAGMYRTGDQIEGAAAYITSRFSGVCDTDSNPINNFTNAWTMVASNNGQSWIQSGFERGFGTGVRHFSQVISPNLQDSTVYGDWFPYNEDHEYWQTLNSANGRMYSNVDGYNFLSTTFPVFNHWGTPLQSEFLGEVRYLESDIPGYWPNATGFWNISTQRRSDHSWQYIPCPYLVSLNSQPSRWAVEGVSCTSFHIYTHTP